MEFEHTTASVISYLLAAAGGPKVLTPYYDAVPDGFRRPSVYFPPPEVEYQAMSLEDWKRLFVMYVVFFGTSLREAQNLAQAADYQIHAHRNFIPVLRSDGTPTRRVVRAFETSVRTVDPDSAAVQYALSWTVPYRFDREPVQKIQKISIEVIHKSAEARKRHFLLEVSADGNKTQDTDEPDDVAAEGAIHDGCASGALQKCPGCRAGRVRCSIRQRKRLDDDLRSRDQTE